MYNNRIENDCLDLIQQYKNKTFHITTFKLNFVKLNWFVIIDSVVSLPVKKVTPLISIPLNNMKFDLLFTQKWWHVNIYEWNINNILKEI